MWVCKWQNVHVWVDCPFKREEKAGCLCVQWGKGKRLQADGLCSEISAELWEGSGMGQGQGSKQTHLLRCTHTAEGLWPEWQRLITAAEARENKNNGDGKTCAFIYNSISLYTILSLSNSIWIPQLKIYSVQCRLFIKIWNQIQNRANLTFLSHFCYYFRWFLVNVWTFTPIP